MATDSDSKTQNEVDRKSWKLIKQGAEARVYRGEHSGKSIIIKERFTKSYRVPVLDQRLTSRRMNQEVRSIARCLKNGVLVPEVYRVDNSHKLIYMEDIQHSIVLRELLDQCTGGVDTVNTAIMESVGTVLAKLHNIDLIHGDLTTSNMMYNQDKNEITLIDFGLSFVSNAIEDKGVDLYVLERAFISTHPNTESCFEQILHSYKSMANNGDAIISKLDEVRSRGRKRTMVG